MEERLQKLMSQAGLGSRRDCEALIEAGRVTVNGRVIHLGDKADPATDTILVDGQPLKPAEQKIYIAIYKPRGVLSAVESPDPRPTVRDLIPVSGHIYPVGRLDVDSEGLMLLTNDGDLANRLTHPRYEHEKEYRVLVARRPDDEQLETWRRGVVLEDGYHTQPADVRIESSMGKGAWLRVILKEGRKRQIRETGSRIGLPVVKIIRVRIGTLTVGVLQPREWRYLTSQEIAALKGQSTAPAEKPARRGQFKPGGAPAGRPSFRASTGSRPAARSSSRPARPSARAGRPGDRSEPGERSETGPGRRPPARGTRSTYRGSNDRPEGGSGSRPSGRGTRSAGRSEDPQRSETGSGRRPPARGTRSAYRSGNDRPEGGSSSRPAGRGTRSAGRSEDPQRGTRPDTDHTSDRPSRRPSGPRPTSRGPASGRPAGGRPSSAPSGRRPGGHGGNKPTGGRRPSSPRRPRRKG